MNSRILDFYRGGQDDQGRTLDEILNWTDVELEAVHDFIQWLFPLPERSGANPSAPMLEAATIDAFLNSEDLRQRLRLSFLRMLSFYGLEFRDGAVQPRANFAARSANWLSPSNHNHLRLTRTLRSLRLLGLAAESTALFAALAEIYANHPDRITLRTYQFWQNAVE
ncbi:opioid growth factor receptor-related protein [Alloacidobacterium sp.]|uniref:opioid growth factor receptor-related protein n=1 Tax=Alloacidobacterium sp. TaxID=2951999 RepID=UPI002D3190D8|nr:opioid growth factor receptor-related protein [Alloacidobacterium sp.]HYK38026.1 opioid growth factor receptor-related protein [Alloacidobacterium sp.]